jgi:hypothetical protein
LTKAVWHPNRDDVAVGFEGKEQVIPDLRVARNAAPISFVVVFLLQPGGTYIAVDVSQVAKALFSQRLHRSAFIAALPSQRFLRSSSLEAPCQ